jgi:hypothetical protein
VATYDLMNAGTSPRLRISVASSSGTPRTITVDRDQAAYPALTYPAKEWSLADDVLNISDTAAVTVANDEGQVSGLFDLGQLVTLEESDPDVAGGQWVPHFTGRLTQIETHSDEGGGSVLLLTMMDLGWHLTSCHAQPLRNLLGIAFDKLLEILLDPSWGLTPVWVNGNDHNRNIQQGRAGITRGYMHTQGSILPYIQVEPGQAPFDVLRTYAAREGVLINVGAHGELLLFRPRYDTDPVAEFHYHGISDDRRKLNNVVGRPSLRQSIDGLYSEVQCWSTLVIPPVHQTTDPNASFTHSVVTPKTNPLPFTRRHVFSDGEAINKQMREMRARWKLQMDAFNSWTYELEVPGHSQGGAFYVSDTMATVSDTVNGVEGTFYVASVRRSQTIGQGTRTHLSLRLPGLLDPTLQAQVGGGAKKVRPGTAKKPA